MINIRHFVCPHCKRGQGFIFIDNDTIQCDSCYKKTQNPIINSKHSFTITFLEDIIVVDIDDLEVE